VLKPTQHPEQPGDTQKYREPLEDGANRVLEWTQFGFPSFFSVAKIKREESRGGIDSDPFLGIRSLKNIRVHIFVCFTLCPLNAPNPIFDKTQGGFVLGEGGQASGRLLVAFHVP